jgi:hypothetical protein
MNGHRNLAAWRNETSIKNHRCRAEWCGRNFTLMKHSGKESKQSIRQIMGSGQSLIPRETRKSLKS